MPTLPTTTKGKGAARPAGGPPKCKTENTRDLMSSRLDALKQDVLNSLSIALDPKHPCDQCQAIKKQLKMVKTELDAQRKRSERAEATILQLRERQEQSGLQIKKLMAELKSARELAARAQEFKTLVDSTERELAAKTDLVKAADKELEAQKKHVEAHEKKVKALLEAHHHGVESQKTVTESSERKLRALVLSTERSLEKERKKQQSAERLLVDARKRAELAEASFEKHKRRAEKHKRRADVAETALERATKRATTAERTAEKRGHERMKRKTDTDRGIQIMKRRAEAAENEVARMRKRHQDIQRDLDGQKKRADAAERAVDRFRKRAEAAERAKELSPKQKQRRRLGTATTPTPTAGSPSMKTPKNKHSAPLMMKDGAVMVVENINNHGHAIVSPVTIPVISPKAKQQQKPQPKTQPVSIAPVASQPPAPGRPVEPQAQEPQGSGMTPRVEAGRVVNRKKSKNQTACQAQKLKTPEPPASNPTAVEPASGEGVQSFAGLLDTQQVTADPEKAAVETTARGIAVQSRLDTGFRAMAQLHTKISTAIQQRLDSMDIGEDTLTPGEENAQLGEAREKLEPPPGEDGQPRPDDQTSSAAEVVVDPGPVPQKVAQTAVPLEGPAAPANGGVHVVNGQGHGQGQSLAHELLAQQGVTSDEEAEEEEEESTEELSP